MSLQSLDCCTWVQIQMNCTLLEYPVVILPHVSDLSDSFSFWLLYTWNCQSTNLFSENEQAVLIIMNSLIMFMVAASPLNYLIIWCICSRSEVWTVGNLGSVSHDFLKLSFMLSDAQRTARVKHSTCALTDVQKQRVKEKLWNKISRKNTEKT